MRNWAGNVEYQARHVHAPTSLDELRELVQRSERIRPIGSRHSFNDIADTTGDQVSLDRMPRRIEIDVARQTVTVGGAIRYGDLCGPLEEAGLALHNLASLPHISIAGACATGTHGSGDRSGSLASAVAALELVIADGEIVRLSRADDPRRLELAAVGLGALGVVTALTLDLEPTYLVRQDVFEDLPLSGFVDHFDDITAMADSVSLFTEWRGPSIDMVWLKRRVDPGSEDAPAPSRLFGAEASRVDRHPIRRRSPGACTLQLGVAGPWHERLPHFRMDHTPSAGDELQTEYLVPRERLVDAFLALDRLRDRIAPHLHVSEIRTIASEQLALSMAADRASASIHFTWKPDVAAVEELLPAIEATLRPFEPRPHWSKLFSMAPDEVRSRYPRLPDFVALADRHDPDGKFRNAFLDHFVFGPS